MELPARPSLSLSREQMLARARARDRGSDGVFLTCVRTTGIYCLPSCRARTPKPENVEHCATPEAARARGFRPCLRCRPDEFYAGIDRDRQALLDTVVALRTGPGEFDGVGALAGRAGVGATKLAALCRHHFHRTPADLIRAARVEFACAALRTTARRVLDVALDAGFATSSAFHANFKSLTGTTPSAYRASLRGDACRLALPPGHAIGACLDHLVRDPDSVCERREGDVVHLARMLDGRPAVLSLRPRSGGVECRVKVADGTGPGPVRMAAAHRVLRRVLRLDLDAAPAERALMAEPRLRGLVRRARGLRPWGTATPFEALVWAVLGQQVRLGFAHELRAAVVARCGTRIGDLVAHPEPETLANLDVRELRALRCSRAKAECLTDAARAASAGALDLDTLLAGSAPLAIRTLEQVRGIGSWTAQYVAMRGLLFADCLPAGDTALASAMQQAFGLPDSPVASDVAALAAPFAPHRSLFTFHLWHSLGAASRQEVVPS